jgi:hypothetical protein
MVIFRIHSAVEIFNFFTSLSHFSCNSSRDGNYLYFPEKCWWCLLAPQRHAVRVNHRVFILFSDILFIFFIVILYKKIDGNFSHSFSRIFNFCTNLSRFSSNSSWGGNYIYFPENLVDILIINSNFPDVNLKQVVSYLIVIIRERIFLWW